MPVKILFVFFVTSGCSLWPIDRIPSSENSKAILHSAQMCSKKNQVLLEGLRQNLSFDETAEAEFGASSLDVILLGVEHLNFESVIYPLFIRNAKKQNPKLDCFFIESEIDPLFPNSQKAFDLLNKSDESLLTTENTGYDSEYIKFLLTIRRMGLKIFFVDRPGDITDEDVKNSELKQAWSKDRNKIMSENISKLHKQGMCKVSFYPVGAAHLSDPKKDVTLTSYLRSAGLKTNNYLLLIAGRNSAKDDDQIYDKLNPGWTWVKRPVQTLNGYRDSLVCENNTKLPNSSFAFNVPKISAPVAYMPVNESFLLNYQDFKTVFVFRCIDSKTCTEFNKSLDAATP